MQTEDQKARNRENRRRYLERLKAKGLKPTPRSKESQLRNRELMAAKRKAAKAAGTTIPGDGWAAKNPDKHRKNVARWRAENLDRAAELTRRSQAARRSTPWGTINNRMWSIVHGGVGRGSKRVGPYNRALGYTWADLRAHLELQFSSEMTWENWGSVWELDHIAPLSSFQYLSIDDPLFEQAWRLSNLRPLPRSENQAKGKTIGV